ncbi:hypothetical protein [Sporohalobacter salinus]|uniref:hypothetical protein n=1 Tax=Sporohalobacter salinus TaxID=1494606 RepID=UPI0019610A0A|nr:hypothetical protein [Sporohalobacter salinus]MBM7625145.1 hypothetical protein [Sporohalobacter salinus]
MKKIKYNLKLYWNFIHFILAVMLFPFVIVNINSEIINYVNVAFLMSTHFFSNELFFLFLRQVQKINEKILYRSFLEKIKIFIHIVLILSFFGTEVYYFLWRDPIPFITCLVFIFLWYVIQKLAVSIGEESIIIGKKIFNYKDIDNVIIKKNNIIIKMESDCKEYEFRILKRDKDRIEKVLKKALK